MIGFRDRALAAAMAHGATVERDGSLILIHAPEGQHWMPDAVHSLVCHSWREAFERMQDGLADCTDACA